LLVDFLSPARILFGPGCSDRIGQEVARLGKKPLIVTGKNSLTASGNIDRILQPLKYLNIQPVFFMDVPPEPTAATVDAVRETAQQTGCDLIVGVGGGSVLDTAKAAAGLFREDAPAQEYLRGKAATAPRLPWIAVPTTAGSGSEVTDNAVLIDPEQKRKSSLRNEFWIADTAIVDPVFTMSMPKQLTATTGMDALAHAVESYTSRWANPYSSALSQAAAVLIIQNIYSAYDKGRKEFREKMMLASLLAGLAINNVRAGAAHALAHPIGVRYGLRHGLVCAVLLPYVMEYNLPLVEHKYAQLAYAANLAKPDTPGEEAAQRLIKYVRLAQKKLGIPPRLGEIGLKREDIREIAAQALDSASMLANPRQARVEDLAEILEKNL